VRKVLFLCTGNSARSQIAEGFLRHLGGSRVEALSAGSKPTGQVHPLAEMAMARAGISLAGHRSKNVSELLGRRDIDLVVTVCDAANEACPVLPGATARAHWSFPDPAAAPGPDEEALPVFEEVRDRIRRAIERLLALSLETLTPAELGRRVEEVGPAADGPFRRQAVIRE
jgi:arsenate reductase (thioredoxin)